MEEKNDFAIVLLSVCPHQSPLDEPVVLTDEVIFPLTVSLDKLPVSTLKVKVCFFSACNFFFSQDWEVFFQLSLSTMQRNMRNFGLVLF